MDYDGDGKLDLCNIHPGGLTIYSFDTSMQLSSIYSGTELTSDENPQKAKEFLLGDINGDGKTDILYYIIDHTPNVPKMFSDWICLYSKGKGGFEETHTGIQQYGKRILQDVNNDGLPDLIFNESSLLTYLNKNGTFGSRDLYMNNTGARYTEGDFMVIPATLSRNNYQSSLICIGNNNVIWSFAYNRDNTRNRMLTETTNSFGVKNYHSYKQLDAPDSNYHSETQASGYPYTNLFGKMHLIEYTETYDPGGAADTDPGMTSRIWYNYYDGVIHKQGLGFCGFKKVEVSDEVKRKKYTQIFDPYKYGLPVSEDSPEATVNYSYTFKPNTGKILRLDKTTNEVYNKLTGTTHSSEVNYDNYGNAVSEIADYGSGFKTRIDREFLSSTSNEAANCTNLPRKELMRKYIGTKSSSTSTMRYYSSGNLSRIQSYYDTLLVKEQEFIRDSGCKDNILTSKEKNYNAGEDRWLASNFEYDSKGRLTKQIDPLGLSTYYTYDPVYGRPESTKNHKNKITSYLYDELGRLVQTTYPDDTYRKMTFEWSKNIAEGSRFPHIGSEDISYSHQLSEGGKVVACKQITLQPGFSFEASTGNSLSMEINKDECLYIQPYGFLTYVVTEEATGSPTVKKYMDVFNREMRTSQMSFDGNYLNTDTEYDSNGRVSKKSQPFKTGSEPRWNSYTYDNYDRPSKITYYSGKSDEFRYNGDEVTSIASGITSTKKYNSAGQLVQVRDTAGTIAYNYRPDGQPESIVAPGGITTSFEYDNYGRKVKLIDPSAGTQTYAYDEEGRLISEAEGEGREIIYTYDNFNRITSKVRDEYDTQYLYDNEGRLGAEVSNGYSLSRRYTYDQFDRVAWVIETSYDGKSVKEIFTYGNGQLQSTQYESNAIRIAKEEYIYTHGHHTETILNGVGSIFKLKAEDESGRTTQIETGKLTRNYGYDMYGLPTSHLVLLTSGTTLYDQRYEFDVLTGNLKYRKDAKRNITESFGYDHLNRLTTLNGDTYVSYDDKGNITYRAGIGYFEYNHPSKPYAVTDLIQTNNVVPSGNQEITYTSTRRFATISENGYFAQFQYDSSDDRTKMQVTHNEQDYLTRYYIGSRYEKDITPMHTKEKLYLGGDAYSAPAVYVKEDDGEWTLHYLLRDYLGSIAQVTDSNGVLVQELSYDPWGRLRNPNTHEYYASGTEPELFLGRGYTGHEHLAMFGLINMNARLYDPITGRFLSPDPYVQAPDFSQNHNRYSYGLNNPLVFSDPSGEFIFTILSGLFCPVLMPVAMGIDMGLISGGMRGIMTPGMNFWDGAWRGGLVGVVGGGLSMFGGGSFLSNVSLGMLGGAITGGLDAALWGNDIGKGIFQGAAIGGVMALIQSTSQSIENYREYGIFDTNDGTFNKLVNDAFIENPTTRSYSIDEIGAQRALDFWQARNGGPTLTYAPGQTNGKTDVYGNIKIGEGAFVGGHRAVRQQISHEMGHYIHNVNWDNGIVGGTVSDPGFINVDATYGGDGIYGYNHAIKSTGKYHTGFKMISQETYRRPGTLWKISNPYRNDAWKSYDLRKWLYLLPRRF